MNVLLRSLEYIAENMDPTLNLPPLFEVALMLEEPSLVFVPVLDANRPDGFPGLVKTLINDIVHMAGLIKRVAACECQTTYQVCGS